MLPAGAPLPRNFPESLSLSLPLLPMAGHGRAVKCTVPSSAEGISGSQVEKGSQPFCLQTTQGFSVAADLL